MIQKKYRKSEKEFFEQKWFKILCVIGFYIFLYYQFNGTFQIDEKKLISLHATVKENCKSGGQRNSFKIYFQTKEYSNRFGIYAGGAYGRYTEINRSLIKNNQITIKIHRNNLKKLKVENEKIPIYFLCDHSGIIFNETEFNQGEYDRDSNITIFFIFIFIVVLLKIVAE